MTKCRFILLLYLFLFVSSHFIIFLMIYLCKECMLFEIVSLCYRILFFGECVLFSVFR